MYVLWTVAIGLVLTGVAIAYRLWAPRTPLEVGARGIRDRRLGWGWIPWNEIEGAYPPANTLSNSLTLRLRATERLRRLLRRRPPDGVDPKAVNTTVEIQLDLRGTGVNSVELLQRILAQDVAEPVGKTVPK